jgi:type I restriction enzyme M protein
MKTRRPPPDVVCDPACGTAGFPVAAVACLREHYPGLLHDSALGEHSHKGMFRGFDFDNTTLRIRQASLTAGNICVTIA